MFTVAILQQATVKGFKLHAQSKLAHILVNNTTILYTIPLLQHVYGHGDLEHSVEHIVHNSTNDLYSVM